VGIGSMGDPSGVANISQTPTSILNLTIRLEANETLIPMISCLYENTVNFSSRPTSRIHFCAKNTSFCSFKPLGAQMPKNPQDSPFLLVHVNFHLIHEYLCRPDSGQVTQHAKRQLDRCTHFRTTTQQRLLWLQWAPQIHPKTPL